MRYIGKIYNTGDDARQFSFFANVYIKGQKVNVMIDSRRFETVGGYIRRDAWFYLNNRALFDGDFNKRFCDKVDDVYKVLDWIDKNPVDIGSKIAAIRETKGAVLPEIIDYINGSISPIKVFNLLSMLYPFGSSYNFLSSFVENSQS